VIEKDAAGFYAYCPELGGCQTQRKSLDGLMRNVREAIELYRETLSEEGRQACFSRKVYSTSVEVDVAYRG